MAESAKEIELLALLDNPGIVDSVKTAAWTTHLPYR